MNDGEEIDSSQGISDADHRKRTGARSVHGGERGHNEGAAVEAAAAGVSAEKLEDDGEILGFESHSITRQELIQEFTGPLPHPRILEQFPAEYREAILDRFKLETRTSNHSIERLTNAEAKSVIIGAWTIPILSAGAIGIGVLGVFMKSDIATIGGFVAPVLFGIAAVAKALKKR